jgi:hypothetical protein
MKFLFLEPDMKDDILDAINDSEPVDALSALFSVAFLVAKASNINEFTLSSLFSSTADALFQAHADDEEAEEAEEAEEVDEQTDE